MWMFRCQIVPAQWDAVGHRVSRRNVNIPIRQCTTIYPTRSASEMRHGDTRLSLARRPCPSRPHPTPTSQPPFQTPAGRVLLHKPIQIQSIEQCKSHAHHPLAFLSSARNALKPLVSLNLTHRIVSAPHLCPAPQHRLAGQLRSLSDSLAPADLLVQAFAIRSIPRGWFNLATEPLKTGLGVTWSGHHRPGSDPHARHSPMNLVNLGPTRQLNGLGRRCRFGSDPIVTQCRGSARFVSTNTPCNWLNRSK